VRVVDEPLPGVKLISPTVHEDHRGFFMESYNQRRFAELGIEDHFVQDNHSRSKCGVLRGLHYQLLHPQAKLVRATRGRVYDVVVDIRRTSPTFGRWAGVELSEQNHLAFYAPVGFAHAFLVLSSVAEFQYKCSDFYRAADEYGLPWNDPDLAIEWPLNGLEPELSDRDRGWTPLASLPDSSLPEFEP
jgi:dTDP-4-dehydrorhamnose 3,5-epimerase